MENYSFLPDSKPSPTFTGAPPAPRQLPRGTGILCPLKQPQTIRWCLAWGAMLPGWSPWHSH